MTDDPRTPLLRSADLPPAGPLRRFERSWFGQRPLKADVPRAAHSLSARDFQPTEEGSGNLGRWTIDEAGLPAFRYEIDQYADPRAAYPTTEGFQRRDQWHQVGNQRVTALASNDGTVQVYLADRGGVFLNRFEATEFERPHFGLRQFLYRIFRAVVLFIARLVRRAPPVFSPLAKAAAADYPPPRGSVPPHLTAQLAATRPFAFTGQTAARAAADPAAVKHAYAGGFGYIDDGGEPWATAFRYRPEGAATRRVFGMGYAEFETTHRDIRVTRRVFAPHGDAPLLIAEIEIQNFTSKAVALHHYEYWDVNIHQLQLEWLRSGSFGPLSDAMRREINGFFIPGVEWDESACALRFHQALRDPRPTQVKAPYEPSEIDWYPSDVFLADLNDGPPAALFVDKAGFFGTGDARRPDAVAHRRAGDATVPPAGSPMPYCLVMRRDLTLQPTERRTLRFAYGTARPGQTLAFLAAYRAQTALLASTLAAWKDDLAYFYTGEDPVLHREMAWHAYNLRSAVVWLDFHKARVVPQGSAYLYLHGADGAPRDQALFVLPAVYLDPALARDMLRLIMQVTHWKTGQISYSFCGHGVVSNGLDLHTNPSDLDIFFLLAFCEYISATGDLAFLNEQVPFYPPVESPPGATVLDHIGKALWHLFEVNGIGDHGLVKVGSGDWSDSIVLETALRDGVGPYGVTYANSKKHGESVPNSQMALYVLPLLAAILKDRAPALSEYIDGGPDSPGRLDRLRAAVQAQWNENGWYTRAVLRDVNNQPKVLDVLTLEAQPWALIAAVPEEAERTSKLIERVDELLDRPSPIGAGLSVGGMIWPAVSQLLTWGYARTGRSQLAWRSLNRHTFAMHATAFPNVWINTWSGPDGVHGPWGEHPGGSWSSLVTPMMDFPIMNANQDAMALLGLLRVCGIEPSPSGDGLVFRPHVPRDRFVLELPLLRLEVSPTRVLIEYRAAVDGERTLYIRQPADDVTVRVDRIERDRVERQGDLVVVPISFARDQVVIVDVTARLAHVY